MLVSCVFYCFKAALKTGASSHKVGRVCIIISQFLCSLLQYSFFPIWDWSPLSEVRAKACGDLVCPTSMLLTLLKMVWFRLLLLLPPFSQAECRSSCCSHPGTKASLTMLFKNFAHVHDLTQCALRMFSLLYTKFPMQTSSKQRNCRHQKGRPFLGILQQTSSSRHHGDRGVVI